MKKAFTLIELLVVIAIIGILSSVAIVYLGDARKKANDAKVSSNVTTASTQVEVDRANGTEPTTDTIAAIVGKLGTYPCVADNRTGYTVDASADFSSVAVYAELCATDATIDSIFCADSSGYRGLTTALLAGDDDGNCLANP